MKGRLVAAAAVAALCGCARAAGAPAAEPPDRYSAIYDRLRPSVALITMRIPADDPKRRGRWDDAYGSGVVTESGPWGSRILTDAHVIADARDLRARIGDRGRAVPVRVLAVSDDADDLALLEVGIPSAPAVRFGSAREARAGRPIGLMWYPIPDAFADERLDAVVSVYAGRIASVRNGALEIDVPVIPGESGGPVFDAETGDVIALAESRFDDERAIGFATPVDVIRRFLAAHPRR